MSVPGGRVAGGAGPEPERSSSAICAKRAGLLFPLITSHVERLIPVSGGMAMSTGAMLYLSAVLEYLVAEVMELSGNAAVERSTIIPRDILLAFLGDEELTELQRRLKAYQGSFPDELERVCF